MGRRTACLWACATFSLFYIIPGPALTQTKPDHLNIEVVPAAGHSRGVQSVAFAPNGRTVLSGSGDNTLKLWDVASGACCAASWGMRTGSMPSHMQRMV